MSARISTADIEAALRRYTRALEQHGIVPETPAVIAAPYGQVYYVMRYDHDRRPTHDLPGFTGSGGSGLLTRRAAYEALMLAAGVLEDAAALRPQEVAR